MAEKFEMLVVDRFSFQDGRTVLVGKVFGHDEPIGACTCDLVVDGQCVGTIKLEGEMLREERGQPTGLRSVSTAEALPQLHGELRLVKAL
jgi:hypothetical protein